MLDVPLSALSAMSVDEEGDFFQKIAHLIEQLKADDVLQRVAATRELPAIADTLGQERTRRELIPFLMDSTDDEDEVLLVMAEQLGGMVAAVGGAQHAHLLLTPLESLAAVEESTVRDAAVTSIITVASQMTPAAVAEHCVPTAKRLALKEWFTARISACGLLAPLYSRLPARSSAAAVRQEIRQLYDKLCKDDTPMVRRVAAASLAGMAGVVEGSVVLEDLLPLFDQQAKDDQDSVRLQIVDGCVALIRVLPLDLRSSRIMPVVLATAADKSWRVRWSIANKIHDLGSAFTGGVRGPLPEALCDAYVELLKDQEAEVRTAAALSVTKVGALLGVPGVLEKLMPCLQQLAIDGCEHVRAALASIICDLSVVLGQDLTVNQLLPLLLTLLKDTNSDVRLNIISQLHSINEVIGVSLLSQSLLPAIVDLAEDSKWRVRSAIIGHMPLLAKQLGANFFNDKLCDICMGCLGDSVYTVRQAAAANLWRLADLFGPDWTRAHVLPKVTLMHTHTSYLHRMTALYAVQVLAEGGMDAELLRRELLPLVLTMAGDPVPNIRFTVSKTLPIIASHLNPGVVEGEIRPALAALADDGDRDVRYFTRKAITLL